MTWLRCGQKWKPVNSQHGPTQQGTPPARPAVCQAPRTGAFRYQGADAGLRGARAVSGATNGNIAITRRAISQPAIQIRPQHTPAQKLTPSTRPTTLILPRRAPVSACLSPAR